jgi:transposase
MTRASKPGKAKRTRHSPQFKSEALALAERLGVGAAAKQLGLHSSQLYDWRSKVRLQRDRGEAEQRLATENARLKRQLAQQAEELAILKKAAAYFAKSLK